MRKPERRSVSDLEYDYLDAEDVYLCKDIDPLLERIGRELVACRQALRVLAARGIPPGPDVRKMLSNLIEILDPAAVTEDEEAPADG